MVPPATAWYRSTPVIAMVLVLSVAATVAWSLLSYQVSPRGFTDLYVYRLGVQAWWRGSDMYGVLPLTNVGLELPFIYPPFAAVILSPLALLSWNVSVVCALLLSLTCLTVTIYLVVRRTWAAGGSRGAILVSAVVFPLSLLTEPVRDTIWFGQINLLLMLLVAADCLVERPPWPRGMLVGIAAAIKLTPAIFLLFFLLRKDFRASVNCVISGAAATAIGFFATWSGSMKFWFGSSGGARNISDSPYFTNQTIKAGLVRLSLPKAELNTLWLLLASIVLVIAVIGIRRAHQYGSTPLAMVITAGLGLIISPTSWGHHWVYAVPAIVVMLLYGVQHRSSSWLIAATLSAAVYGVAPFLYAPGGTHNPELHWTPFQQLIGNSFTIMGIALLIAYVIPALRRPGLIGIDASAGGMFRFSRNRLPGS